MIECEICKNLQFNNLEITELYSESTGYFSITDKPIIIKFCPVCGKKLEKGDNSKDDAQRVY